MLNYQRVVGRERRSYGHPYSLLGHPFEARPLPAPLAPRADTAPAAPSRADKDASLARGLNAARCEDSCGYGFKVHLFYLSIYNYMKIRLDVDVDVDLSLRFKT